jgi:hypothetical protein
METAGGETPPRNGNLFDVPEEYADYRQFRYAKITGDGSCLSYALKNIVDGNIATNTVRPEYPLNTIQDFKMPILDMLLRECLPNVGDPRNSDDTEANVVRLSSLLTDYIDLPVSVIQLRGDNTDREWVPVSDCVRVIERYFHAKSTELSMYRCQQFADHYRINICVWEPGRPVGFQLFQLGGGQPAVFIGNPEGLRNNVAPFRHLLYHRWGYYDDNGNAAHREYEVNDIIASGQHWPDQIFNEKNHFGLLLMMPDHLLATRAQEVRPIRAVILDEGGPITRTIPRPVVVVPTARTPGATITDRGDVGVAMQATAPTTRTTRTWVLTNGRVIPTNEFTFEKLEKLEPGIFELVDGQIRCKKCDRLPFLAITGVIDHKYHVRHDPNRDLGSKNVELERLNLQDDGNWTLELNGQFRCGLCKISCRDRRGADKHIAECRGHWAHLQLADQPPAEQTTESPLHRFYKPSEWSYDNQRYCCKRCEGRPFFMDYKTAIKHERRMHSTDRTEVMPPLPSPVVRALQTITETCASMRHPLEEEPIPDPAIIRDRFVKAFHDTEPAGCAVCGAFKYHVEPVQHLSLHHRPAIGALLLVNPAFQVQYLNDPEQPNLMHVVKWQDQYYRLHPSYFGPPRHHDGEFNVCHKCHLDLTKNPAKLPRFAYANGWDFGYKPVLPKLNIVEQALICKTQTYSTLITFRPKGLSWQTSTKVTGHIISFPQAVESTVENLPRRRVEEQINVLFVGPTGRYTEIVGKLRHKYEVNPENVYKWLHFLKKYNFHYETLPIIDDDDTRAYMAGLWDTIVQTGQQANGPAEQRLYRHAGAPVFENNGELEIVELRDEEEEDEIGNAGSAAHNTNNGDIEPPPEPTPTAAAQGEDPPDPTASQPHEPAQPTQPAQPAQQEQLQGEGDGPTASQPHEPAQQEQPSQQEQSQGEEGDNPFDAVYVNLPHRQQENSVASVVRAIKTLRSGAEPDPVNEFQDNGYLYGAGMAHLFPVFTQAAAESIKFYTFEAAHLVFTAGTTKKTMCLYLTKIALLTSVYHIHVQTADLLETRTLPSPRMINSNATLCIATWRECQPIIQFFESCRT